MPKINPEDEDVTKNAPFRSARREVRRPGTRGSQGRRRGHERRISVQMVDKERPDVRKLARATIRLALAQAEAEARAQAEARTRTEHSGEDRPGAAQ